MYRKMSYYTILIQKAAGFCSCCSEESCGTEMETGIWKRIEIYMKTEECIRCI